MLICVVISGCLAVVKEKNVKKFQIAKRQITNKTQYLMSKHSNFSMNNGTYNCNPKRKDGCL